MDPVLDLLLALNDSITEEPAGTFDVPRYAAAFLFDANRKGVATLAVFRDRYGEHFGDLSNLEHSEWVTTNPVPVGCFVFHSAQDQTGTLEDHLAPMVESAWPGRYAAARHFIDDNREGADEVSSSDAARLKAIVTAAGQFDLPGAPNDGRRGRSGKGSAAGTVQGVEDAPRRHGEGQERLIVQGAPRPLVEGVGVGPRRAGLGGHGSAVADARVTARPGRDGHELAEPRRRGGAGEGASWTQYTRRGGAPASARPARRALRSSVSSAARPVSPRSVVQSFT